MMLTATTVSDLQDLELIHELNQRNLKGNLDKDERGAEGFVTWLYPVELLKNMHALAPSIVVKDKDAIAGYALTTLRECSRFHPDLEVMLNNLSQLSYKGRPLPSYQFYCMGQICVDKNYRGKGVVSLLYDKHREVYSGLFDFMLTEISTSNVRSLRAHEKVGFKTIHSYRDQLDEWAVVVWDWK